jgi:hypothetical protein
MRVPSDGAQATSDDLAVSQTLLASGGGASGVVISPARGKRKKPSGGPGGAEVAEKLLAVDKEDTFVHTQGKKRTAWEAEKTQLVQENQQLRSDAAIAATTAEDRRSISDLFETVLFSLNPCRFSSSVWSVLLHTAGSE